MKPIVSAAELMFFDKNDIIIFDVSSGSESRYAVSHLEGALYIDLERHLADVGDFRVGGRHPLPIITEFIRVLEGFGVTNESHLVLYDDKNGSNAAARFWWMLRAIGHKKVQVLNGGFQAAVTAGYSTSSDVEMPVRSKYVAKLEWQLATVSIQEVDIARQDLATIVIDVRDNDRYLGLREPIDLIAGHIPGAINIPFTENLDAMGFFRPEMELNKKYNAIFGGTNVQDIIVHCGSGVTACHTLLALDYAGLGIPKLYVGSWSEWSRNSLPIGSRNN